jgi:queuosine precursor transporter
MLDSLKNKEVKLYIILSGFFIANALCAEFMGVKIFSLENSLHLAQYKLMLFGNAFSFNLSSGVLLWPVVFIMTDTINEFYGTKGVKFLSYLTAALIGYAFLMFFWAINLSPADFWTNSKVKTGIPNLDIAFAQIFGQGLGIIIGSLVAFLVGQVVDVVVFHKIKKMTGEKFIWLRSTGSTLISQFIDSFVVLIIAFYIYPRMFPGPDAPWSFMLVLSIGLGNYLYKFVVAIAMTPVIYLIHHRIEKYLGYDLANRLKAKAAGE